MAASELQKMLAGEMYDPFAHQLRQLGLRHAIFAGSSTRRASRRKRNAGGFSRERRLVAAQSSSPAYGSDRVP